MILAARAQPPSVVQIVLAGIKGGSFKDIAAAYALVLLNVLGLLAGLACVQLLSVLIYHRVILGGTAGFIVLVPANLFFVALCIAEPILHVPPALMVAKFVAFIVVAFPLFIVARLTERLEVLNWFSWQIEWPDDATRSRPRGPVVAQRFNAPARELLTLDDLILEFEALANTLVGFYSLSFQNLGVRADRFPAKQIAGVLILEYRNSVVKERKAMLDRRLQQDGATPSALVAELSETLNADKRAVLLNFIVRADELRTKLGESKARAQGPELELLKTLYDRMITAARICIEKIPESHLYVRHIESGLFTVARPRGVDWPAEETSPVDISSWRFFKEFRTIAEPQDGAPK